MTRVLYRTECDIMERPEDSGGGGKVEGKGMKKREAVDVGSMIGEGEKM